MSRRPTTRAELRLLGYAPMQLLGRPPESISLLGQSHADVQLMGATESAALHAALKNLAKKIPSADPGPQPNWNTESGVSDRMIQALASVAGRIPGMPSEVRTALNLVAVGIPLLEQSATGRSVVMGVRSTLSRYGSQLATVINGYAQLVSGTGGGAGAAGYPARSISTWDAGNAVWRVAAPRDQGLSGCVVLPGGEISGADDYLGQMPINPGTYEEIGTAAGASGVAPAGTTQVDNQTYKKATSTPFYRAWWFWVPVGVTVIGGGTAAYFLLRGRRRRW